MADQDYTIRVRLDTSDVARGRQRTVDEIRQIDQAAENAGRRAVQGNQRVQQSQQQTAAAIRQTATAANNLGSTVQAASTAGTTGLNRMLSSTGLLGNSFGRIQNQLTNFNAAIVGFTAAVAGLAAVHTLSEFGDNIASVQAVTQTTGREFEKLRDTALELGRTTRFSASEVAKALEELARSGLDANASIQTVPAVLQLAQAENLNLAQAADIAAKSFRIFRTDAGDIPRLINQISQAATISATNVTEIFNALKYGGPIAAGFKISSEEILAAFSVLSNSGQSASVAGTAVRGILSRLVAPTKEFTDQLKSIGVTLDEVSPRTHTLVEILERLRTAGVSTAAAFQLFKQRAGTGTEVLVTNVEQIKDALAQIATAGDVGLLKIKSDIKADTLTQDLLQAKTAVQALILALGDAGLTAALRIVLQVFGVTLRTLADLIRALIPLINTVGVALAIAFAPAVFVAFEAAIARLVFSVLPAFLSAIYAADTALVSLALSNPFTAIALAIGVVIALLHQFGGDLKVIGTEYATLADLLAVIGERIANGFRIITNAAVVGFTAIGTAGSAVANSVLNVFEVMVNGIISALEKVLNAARTVASVVGGILTGGTGSAAIAGGADLGRIALGRVSADDVLGGVLKDADNRALNRLAEEKKARADAVDGLRSEAQAKLAAAQATDNLTQSGSKGRDKTVTEADRMKNILEELNGPLQEAQRNFIALDKLFEDGKISASQYADELQRIREAALKNDQTFGGGVLRGLNQVAEGATRMGDNVQKFVVGAFNKASDAIANFVTTGKFNFSDFTRSILADLVKLSTNALFGQIAQSFLGSGAGGIFAGGLSLPGFATGGSFVVGGSGSTDSQVVGLRATPGERVTVETPQQQKSSAGAVVNIYNSSNAQARVEKRQGAGGQSITDIIIAEVNDGAARGALDQGFGGRFGVAASRIRR